MLTAICGRSYGDKPACLWWSPTSFHASTPSRVPSCVKTAVEGNTAHRLISVTPLNPASGLNKTTFAYDYRHRRRERQVYEWQTDHWLLFTEQWYVYDGWNVIKETTTTDSGDSTDYYVWGLDVSGTFQGAGGIGGLFLNDRDFS